MKRYISKLKDQCHLHSNGLDDNVRRVITGIFFLITYILYLVMLEPMDFASELPW